MLLIVEIKHLDDDEEVTVILLELGALAGREHIFERERMEIKTRTERAQNIDVAQPVDVDPGDAIVIEVRKELVLVRDRAFLETGAVIFDQRDVRPLAVRPFFPRAQRPRRFARDGIACLEHGVFCDRAVRAAS